MGSDDARETWRPERTSALPNNAAQTKGFGPTVDRASARRTEGAATVIHGARPPPPGAAANRMAGFGNTGVPTA
jgi:hypothetical protein